MLLRRRKDGNYFWPLVAMWYIQAYDDDVFVRLPLYTHPTACLRAKCALHFHIFHLVGKIKRQRAISNANWMRWTMKSIQSMPKRKQFDALDIVAAVVDQYFVGSAVYCCGFEACTLMVCNICQFPQLCSLYWMRHVMHTKNYSCAFASMQFQHFEPMNALKFFDILFALIDLLNMRRYSVLQAKLILRFLAEWTSSKLYRTSSVSSIACVHTLTFVAKSYLAGGILVTRRQLFK